MQSFLAVLQGLTMRAPFLDVLLSLVRPFSAYALAFNVELLNTLLAGDFIDNATSGS